MLQQVMDAAQSMVVATTIVARVATGIAAVRITVIATAVVVTDQVDRGGLNFVEVLGFGVTVVTTVVVVAHQVDRGGLNFLEVLS
jgi:hypothetical protein